MMLEEPDLVDADPVRQLDFFDLPSEHFLVCRIFTRGRGRPDGQSHRPTLPIPATGRRMRCLTSISMVSAAARFVNRTLARAVGRPCCGCDRGNRQTWLGGRKTPENRATLSELTGLGPIPIFSASAARSSWNSRFARR